MGKRSDIIAQIVYREKLLAWCQRKRYYLKTGDKVWVKASHEVNLLREELREIDKESGLHWVNPPGIPSPRGRGG